MKLTARLLPAPPPTTPNFVAWYPSYGNKEVELAQPVQIKIYQSNTSRKDLHLLHFDDEPRV